MAKPNPFQQFINEKKKDGKAGETEKAKDSEKTGKKPMPKKPVKGK